MAEDDIPFTEAPNKPPASASGFTPPPERSKEERFRFSDVLGGLVSGVAHARKTADYESASIAKIYRDNPYLSGMSVPRLRFERVTIDMPLLVKAVIPQGEAELANEETIAREISLALNEAFFNKLKAGLQRKFGGAPPQAFVDYLNTIADSLSQDLNLSLPGKLASQRVDRDNNDAIIKTPNEILIQILTTICESTTFEYLVGYAQMAAEKQGKPPPAADSGAESPPSAAMDQGDLLRRLLDSDLTPLILDKVRSTARDAAIIENASPPDFYVGVNTDEIKNNAPNDVVTRIRIVMTEEGMEWLKEDGAPGKDPNWKLVRE